MLSSVYTKTHTDRLGRIWRHQIGIFICDSCGTSFERRTSTSQKSTHFCNRKCFNNGAKKGGAADQARKRTCKERFGVEHPMLDPNSTYRQKRDKTCMKRYGSTVPTKSEDVKSKTRATNIERFGVPFPMTNEDVKARMVESLKQNDLQAIAIKRIETMKRNGSFRKSHAEDKMCALLVKRFGIDDVERNKRPIGTAWPIDFYVKSIDTWIQVDGIYWHGLDGQLEEHRKRVAFDKRSRIIVYKWETDRRQELWFAERGMRLLRITDKQVSQVNDARPLLDA